MINVFLYLLLSLIIPSTAIGGEDTQDICSDYLHENTGTGPGPVSPGSIPYGTGLIWKIKDKKGNSAHLFGTIHSQDRLVTALPPAVRLALAKSRTLVMEVMLDEEANRIFSESLYFRDGTDLVDLVDRSVFMHLQEVIEDYGINRENVSRLKPWAAFTLIGRPRPVNAPTLDIKLMQIAASTNKLITGLESMDELVSSLDGISMDDQIVILNDTVCNHAGIIRKSRDLVQLYVRRDLAGMVSFNQQPHNDEAVFARFMQQMLYDRNKRMLDRIENYIHQGDAFIAIGALHLPGERGLLKALERKGYTIMLVY